jgi:hypothetical protein
MTTPLSELTPTVNPCLSVYSQEGAFFLECVTREGRVYGFPYSHLSNYILEPNPTIEDAPDAPPDRLSLWFSAHQVIILGWQLDELRSLIRKGTGVTVKALEPRYANLEPKKCFVSEVAVLSAGA